jgi:hypothetical protein
MSKRSNVAGTISGLPYSEGCQLKCVPNFEEDNHYHPENSYVNAFKRFFALPWNKYVKQWLKRGYYSSGLAQNDSLRLASIKAFTQSEPLRQGQKVRVRSKEEIISTLDPLNELKGCSFLDDMQKYCGSEQRVLRSMKYFMDERDYKRKKTRGLILLENIMCNGTPVFGSCDRCCFLFWREEWLERM